MLHVPQRSYAFERRRRRFTLICDLSTSVYSSSFLHILSWSFIPIYSSVYIYLLSSDSLFCHLFRSLPSFPVLFFIYFQIFTPTKGFRTRNAINPNAWAVKCEILKPKAQSFKTLDFAVLNSYFTQMVSNYILTNFLHIIVGIIIKDSFFNYI